MTTTRTKVLAFLFLLGIGGMVAALFLSATARADTLDDRFVNALSSQGIASMDGDTGLVRMGHLVCEYRAKGAPGYQLAQWITSKTNLDLFHAGYLVGAAEGVYCPSLYDGPTAGSVM